MKKHCLLLAACFLFHAFQLSAQWSLTTSPPVSPGNNYGSGIAFPSSSTGFVSAYNGDVFKTTNAGQNWAPVFESQLPDLISLEGLSFYNTQIGCAFGANLNAGMTILSTVNGGSSWSMATISSPSPFDAIISADYATATTIYVSASTGQIFKSVNGGLNWQPVANLPLITQWSVSVDFVDADLGFALSGGSLFKTINGGQSWSTLNASGFNKIQFADADHGWACEGGRFYHTLNGGQDWQRINDGYDGPETFMMATAMEGFGIKENVPARTLDGGKSWFKQSLPVTGSSLDAIFSNRPGEGWLTGNHNGPFVAKTTNGGGFGSRIKTVTDTLDCANSTLHAEAETIGGPVTAAKWWLNGQQIGTGLVLDWVGNLPSGQWTLEFQAQQGTSVIVNQRTIYRKFPPDFPPSSFIPSITSLCAGEPVQIYTDLVSDDSFFFYLDGVLWQGPVTVDASLNPYPFDTPPLQDTVTGEVRVKYACGWFTVSTFKIIVRPLPVDTFSMAIDQNLYCDIGNKTYIHLSYSEPNSLYVLLANGQNTGIASTTNWNAFPLLFDTPVFDSTTVFSIKAFNLQSQCNTIMQDSVTAFVERPKAWFGVLNDAMNLPNGTPVVFNFGGQEAQSFDWNFGTGAVPPSSASAQPGSVVFPPDSGQTIRLIVTAPLGCRDTFERAVGFYAPGPLPETWVLEVLNAQLYNIFGSNISVDAQKNVFVHQGRTSTYPVTGLNWPTTAGSQSLQPPSGESLAKYDTYGVLTWSVDFPGFYFAIRDLAPDQQGNLFLAMEIKPGENAKTGLRYGSTDGNFVETPKFDHGALIKYDPGGRLLWQRTFNVQFGGNTERVIDVAVSTDGSVYLLGEAFLPGSFTLAEPVVFDAGNGTTQTFFLYGQFVAKYNNNGALLWVQPLDAGLNDFWLTGRRMQLDPAGNILICGSKVGLQPTALVVKLDPDGNLLWRLTPGSSTIDETTDVLETGPDGSVYIAGRYVQHLQLGALHISGDATGLFQNFFVAKISPDGIPLWLRSGQLEPPSVNQPAIYLNVMIWHDDALLLRGNFYGNLQYDQTQVDGSAFEAAFLFKLDPGDGDLLGHQLFDIPDPADPYTLYDCTGRSMAEGPDGALHFIGDNGFQVPFGDSLLMERKSMYIMKGAPNLTLKTFTPGDTYGTALLRITPNPSGGQAFLEVAVPEKWRAEMLLADATGRVKTIQANMVFEKGVHRIPLPEVDPGMYFVVVRRENGRMAWAKWVVLARE